MRITQPVCVCVYGSVALGSRHEVRMRHIVICGLARSAIFFNYLIYGKIFEKIYTYIEHRMCVLIFSTNFV